MPSQPEHRMALRHTCERPIVNPYRSKSQLNPNWKWNRNGDKLSISQKPKGLKQVVAFTEENIEKLSKLESKFGSLIIKYENGHYKFASAFRVGPKKWATAGHSLDYEQSTRSIVDKLYITLEHELPYSGHYVELDDYLDEHQYFACTKIAYTSASTDERVIEDKDPLRMDKKAWTDKSDFLFLHVPDDDSEDFLLPHSVPVDKEEYICLLGYHLPVEQSWIEDHFGRDEYTVSKLRDTFHGFNKKSMSPGHIMSHSKERLLAHSSSSLPGSAGSAVVLLKHPDYFTAVHIGAWERERNNDQEFMLDVNNNYNLAVSIHHPAFVIEYFKHIYSILPETAQKLVKPYLDLHSNLLKEVM
jgi:hypothetical protein